MFGILAPCPARTPEDLRPRWMGHFCGLCLELRDEAGHAARLTTNYDALTLSALVEGQTESREDARTAGPCALRGMRRQRIPTGGGPRLAASASLLLAAAKLDDHRADRDGLASRPGFAGIARRTADRYRAKALAIGDAIDLPVDRVTAAIDLQQAAEAAAGPGTALEAVTAPTAEATAELFAHAAVLADRPGNIAPFRAAGAAFGALAHLLDAADDYEDDLRRGAWNPLRATGTSLDRARRTARGLLSDLGAALETADLADATMPRLLLGRYASHAVAKSFGTVCSNASHQVSGADQGPPKEPGPHYQGPPGGPPPEPGWRPGKGFWAGMCGLIVAACGCQACCAAKCADSCTDRSCDGCASGWNCDCSCDRCGDKCCDRCCGDCRGRCCSRCDDCDGCDGCCSGCGDCNCG
ncbi:DUF5685 family protein [Glycomyces salinus]|uniref:DUF5685 family protein n=1 Tax=Glycomyces salinus TaxID=980294 RepID=UPI0018EAFF2F|nr:DUF5685 family protein [Glycomyces salinus]